MANQNIIVPILYSDTVVMGAKRMYALTVISQTEIPELWTRFSVQFNAVMLRISLTRKIELDLSTVRTRLSCSPP